MGGRSQSGRRKHEDDGCLRWEESPSGAPEFHPIVELIVAGPLKIDVAEISLRHMKLGEVAASYGTGSVSSSDALLVVTESESQFRAVLRTQDGEEIELQPADIS